MILRTSAKRIFVFVLFMMVACVEPYPPPASGDQVNFVVVDGFLNASTKSVTVKISHAVPLASPAQYPPEEEAAVSIEGDKGVTFTLSEAAKGVYEAQDIEVDPSENYSLHFVTKGGKSYRSKYVGMRRSPLIDSVVWRPEPTGTRFYVNGHDPSNSTTYYRYLFTDTWEYRVPIYSFWKKVGGLPVFRDPVKEQVFTCWRTSHSTEILTASTKRLTEDVVNMLPVYFIAKGSRELSRRYSINIQQRAISEEEYEYWQLIRKTTESLGGLFDPLPSQVISNLQNEEDPKEQVLGYFSGGFVTEKRMFVSFYDLPDNLKVVDGWDFTCEGKFVPIDHPEQAGSYVFVEQIGQPPTGYSAFPANCADCTSLGGENKPPPFWVP
jgi:hypothetical protein